MMPHAEQKPVVYLSGIFDDMRTPVIRFLQEAARLGNVHALLYSDALAQQISGERTNFPQAERKYFLENIRFVNQVSLIDNGDADALPAPCLGCDHNEIIWAVREGEANPNKAAFCADSGITYAVIPDADLAGFPLEEPVDDPSRKKVMVSGCFDWVHSGHVRFFEEAAEYGDLYVVVGHDDNLRLLKGEGHPLFPQEERQYWVHAIRFVHRAPISTGHGWLDSEPEVRRYKPDSFLVNHDGDKPEKRRFFSDMGIDYIVLERKPKQGLKARESTQLRGF